MSYPVLLEAVLGAEVAILDADFQTGRALQRARIIRAILSKAFLLGRRFVCHGEGRNARLTLGSHCRLRGDGASEITLQGEQKGDCCLIALATAATPCDFSRGSWWDVVQKFCAFSPPKLIAFTNRTGPTVWGSLGYVLHATNRKGQGSGNPFIRDIPGPPRHYTQRRLLICPIIAVNF